MKQKTGFTLIEIIVSMLILSLILLSIAGIFISGKRHIKRAECKQVALNFAREKVEQLEILGFNNLCLQDGTYPTVDCPDERIFPAGWQRTWIINDDVDLDGDGNPDRKNITVTVRWQGPSL